MTHLDTSHLLVRPAGVDAPARAPRRRFDPVLSALLAPVLDRCLARGAPPEKSRLLAARAAWLVSPGHRHELADAWLRIVDDAQRPVTGLGTRVPVARTSVLAAAAEVDALVVALRRPAPVGAREVLDVRALLADGTGAVYAGGDLRGQVVDLVLRLTRGRDR